MDLLFTHLLPQHFAPNAKVWIYQSNRKFFVTEALQIEAMMEDFVASWNSHGTPVQGYANLFFGQFIILMADETTANISGCSTDSSVRLIKQVETLFKVNMFDRQSLAFVIKDKIEMLPLAQLNYALQNGFIQPTTLYFNNLVATKQQLQTNWIIEAQNSWLAAKIKTATTA